MFLHMALFLCIINIDMQINKNNLEWLQIDITARCQAACLECSRNIDGGEVTPLIGKSNTWDMPIEIFQKAVTKEMLSNPNFKKIALNGNFGDPCIHPQFIDICDYIANHAHKNFRLSISTNGAMFKSDYWKKVANVLQPIEKHLITFGIDGLEDTHHIYRRNTKYEDVITNAKTFIDAGGRASWQFIIFNHNAHQVDEVKLRAKQLGFTHLNLKGGYGSTMGGARNYQKAINDDLGERNVTKDIGIKTKKNKAVELSVKEREGFKKAKNNIKKVQENLKTKSKKELLDTAKISCQWYDTKGMYVEYDGTVWMCCWTGDMHKRKHSVKNPNDAITLEWKHIESKFEKNFNNLNYHSFDDILNHEFFVDYLDKSFNSTTQDPNTPRLSTCAKTCIWGKTFVGI